MFASCIPHTECSLLLLTVICSSLPFIYSSVYTICISVRPLVLFLHWNVLTTTSDVHLVMYTCIYTSKTVHTLYSVQVSVLHKL